MKNEYKKPEMNVIVLKTENVLTVSATLNKANFGIGENEVKVYNIIDY